MVAAFLRAGVAVRSVGSMVRDQVDLLISVGAFECPRQWSRVLATGCSFQCRGFYFKHCAVIILSSVTLYMALQCFQGTAVVKVPDVDVDFNPDGCCLYGTFKYEGWLDLYASGVDLRANVGGSFFTWLLVHMQPMFWGYHRFGYYPPALPIYTFEIHRDQTK